MVRKTIYLCDRCGQEIKGTGTRIMPYFFDTVTEERTEDIDLPESDVHFCVGCAKKILGELGRPPDENETGKEAAAGEKGQKRRRRLDTGKVMALHRAGWSNAEIADEMRATERQIYQCLRYLRKKAALAEGKGDGHETESG